MATVAKRFDVCAGKKFTNAQNEVKSEWFKCGKMILWSDGGISLEMLTKPEWDGFDGKYSVFEQKPNEQQPQQVVTTAPQPQYQAPVTNANGTGLPF